MAAGEKLDPPSTTVDLLTLDPQDLGALLTSIDQQRTRLIDLLPHYKQAINTHRPDLYPDRVKALNAFRVQVTYALKKSLGHVPKEKQEA